MGMTYTFLTEADIPVGPRATADFANVEVEVLNEYPWEEGSFDLKLTENGIETFERNHSYLKKGIRDYIVDAVLKEGDGEIQIFEMLDAQGTENPMYDALMEAWIDEFGEPE